MEMTIEESLNNLIELQKDYQQFHNDVWQDPESYGIMAESLQVAIDTIKSKEEKKMADGSFLVGLIAGTIIGYLTASLCEWWR